jgi:hypothetical protein
MNLVTVNAAPHAGQKAVHDCPARFRVLDAGRRWGKTRLGVMECIDVANRGGIAWWVSPTYKMSEVGWRPLRQIASRIPGADVSLAERRVTFQHGGSVTVRSSDSPNSLRGEGLDFLVMDECAFITEDAWLEALRPTLSDRKGKALFISTPKGRNWFWNVYQRGLSGGEWASFQFPTRSNPYIDPSEIEEARRTLPERVFLQEYEAVFLEDGGGVFRRVQEAATSQPVESWQEGRQYVAGVDVASLEDFTVVSVLDVEANALVYLDHFNRVDYTLLEGRLDALYKRFKMDAMQIEVNSIGQGVVDHLQNRGMHIIPFTTTNATKQAAIQDLVSAFEHGNIKILNDPGLINELLSFEATRNKSGSFSYSAPDGLHDDYVMSLAIAWNAIGRRTTIIDDPFAGW